MKKILFLVVLLIIPVILFLFFMRYGENKFYVPFYYETGIPGCGSEGGQHYVPEPEFLLKDTTEKLSRSEGFHIYALHENKTTGSMNALISESVRVLDMFYPDNKLHIFLLVNEDEENRDDMRNFITQQRVDTTHLIPCFVNNTKLKWFSSCGLGVLSGEDTLITDMKFVMVDEDHIIRGYYDVGKKEETDRLILELKILLEDRDTGKGKK